jgi:broad-specificity NMP kinase
MNKLLLILTGKSGAGKDTVADYLVKAHHFKKYNFATIMKAKCAELYKVEERYFYDRDKKDSPLPNLPGKKTPRDLLIEFGAKTRSQDPDYWSKILFEEMKKEIDHNRFVIADCRLHSEIRFMKNTNFFDKVVVVWVSRRDIEQVPDNIESSIEDADIVVNNDETPFNGKVVDECLIHLFTNKTSK